MQNLVERAKALASSFAPPIRWKYEGASDRDRLRTILAELVQRRMEGIALYQALPLAEQAHASLKRWRVASGSNRSGKTQFGSAEFVRAVCGVDPYDKYVPHNGNFIIVGLDLDHLAMMWDKIANPGAFKIIRDEYTTLWRAVRPHPDKPDELDEYDLAYEEKWKDAPPLLPPRMIPDNGIAWEDKAKGIPRHLSLTTGWKGLFRSSNGKPAQGSHYDFAWIDEEIANVQFYYEIRRGLTGLTQKRKWRPKAIWTATRQANNYELDELRERFKEGSPNIDIFEFLIENNPYVPREEIEIFAEGLPEEERLIRIKGEDPMAGKRIYPMFTAQGIHGCEPFEIPLNWARFVYLDPGRQHCATIFLAVDPEERHVWVYDGFDLRNVDAVRWAAEVSARQTPYAFDAFVSDHRCGIQTHIGTNDTVAEVYWSALEEAGIVPRTRSTVKGMAGFFPGSSSVMAREEALIGWMRVRDEGPFAGTPALRVFRGKLPLLEKQIKHAAYELKKPDKRCKYQEDMLVTLEYAAAHHPFYWPPEVPSQKPQDAVWNLWEKKRERKQASACSVVCIR